MHFPVVLAGSVSFLHGVVDFVRARSPCNVRLPVSISLWVLFGIGLAMLALSLDLPYLFPKVWCKVTSQDFSLVDAQATCCVMDRELAVVDGGMTRAMTNEPVSQLTSVDEEQAGGQTLRGQMAARMITSGALRVGEESSGTTES